jgi:hypothetical protein
VAALGPRPGQYAVTVQQYLVAKGGEDDSPSVLFAGPRPIRVLPLPEGEVQTDRPLHDPEKTWDGLVRKITKEEFAAALRQWKELSEKCVLIDSNYVEKLHGITFFLNLNCFRSYFTLRFCF